jgi:hypothetical protein
LGKVDKSLWPPILGAPAHRCQYQVFKPRFSLPIWRCYK